MGPEYGSMYYSFKTRKVEELEKFIKNPNLWDGLDLQGKFLVLLQLSYRMDDYISKGKDLEEFIPLVKHIYMRSRELAVVLFKLMSRRRLITNEAIRNIYIELSKVMRGDSVGH